MSVKRFHSRRSHRRLFLWGGLCSFFALMGILSMDVTGSRVLLSIVGVLVFAGLFWIMAQGKKGLIEYVLGEDALLLRRGAEEERVPLEAVIDANLIDMVTARDYVQQHGDGDGELELGRTSAPRSSTRYCGVPITRSRLGSIVAGISSLSTHNFRQSLVLLRIRDGGVLLLSPKYGESMVHAIGKAKGIVH